MLNLKFALRTLFKTPFVTIVAVLSLGLGIGANAAIFSLFNQMLLKSLPVKNPEQLVVFAMRTSCPSAWSRRAKASASPDAEARRIRTSQRYPYSTRNAASTREPVN